MAHPSLSPHQPPESAFAPGGGAGAVVAAVFAALWAVALAVLSQFAGWFAEQYAVAAGYTWPFWAWPVIAILLGGAAGLPALGLWLIPRSRPVREAGRAWTLAAAVAAVTGVLRAVPLLQNELYLAALTAALIVLAAAVHLLRRGRAGRGLADQGGVPQSDLDRASGDRPVGWFGPERAGLGTVAVAWGVIAGGLTLVAWAWLGALGGWLEILLGVTAAIGVGAVGAAILDGRFWGAFGGARRARLVLLGGLVAGVALVLVASGAGASGTQLAMLFVLPPLAFVAAALSTGSIGAVGVLLAVAAVGPLAFADPDELTIFLFGRDAPYWTMIATIASWLVAVVLAVVIPFAVTRIAARHQPQDLHLAGTPPRRPGVVAFRSARPVIPIVLAAVTVIGTGTVYAAAGQPGSYGERLFVVMKSQASLAGLPTTVGLGPGRDARVAAVYRRLVDHAVATQADLRHQLDRLHLAYRPYYLVNGLRVTGGPEVRALLAQRTDVARVLIDPVLRPLPAPVPVDSGDASAPRAVPWNLAMVGAPEAWAMGATGQGIVVGTSDSGVDGTHPALAAGFRGGDDSWYDPWSGTSTPTDHNGHGTHTLASAVGRLDVGVAPGARWMGCVNLERNLGSTSHYLDCLQFMLAPFPPGGDPFTDGRPARAPHVLTNSWGCPHVEGCDTRTLGGAVDAFAAAGIAFVAAAGNTGPQCGSVTDPPAIYRSAITVAAVDESGTVADFSSRGIIGSGKPDVAGPGQDVLSAMPDGTYATLSGTSMATPHVAGVIALLWSARPGLVGDLTRTVELLRRSAEPASLGASGTACDTETAQAGAGIVNAASALRLAA